MECPKKPNCTETNKNSHSFVILIVLYILLAIILGASIL